MFVIVLNLWVARRHIVMQSQKKRRAATIYSDTELCVKRSFCCVSPADLISPLGLTLPPVSYRLIDKKNVVRTSCCRSSVGYVLFYIVKKRVGSSQSLIMHWMVLLPLLYSQENECVWLWIFHKVTARSPISG